MKLQNLPQRAEFKVWVVDSEQVWKHQATGQLDGSAQQLIRLNLPAPALAFVELETAGKSPDPTVRPIHRLLPGNTPFDRPSAEV